jgi:hypothetical protein
VNADEKGPYYTLHSGLEEAIKDKKISGNDGVPEDVFKVLGEEFLKTMI